MENVISVLNGIFIKTVDEMDDTPNLSFLTKYKQHIYALCTMLFSLWLYNDEYISLLIIIFIAPLCFFIDQIDTDFWRALFPVAIIIFLFKINSLKYNGLWDIIEKCMLFIAGCIYIYLESIMFPEENSTKKNVFRISQIIMFLLLALFVAPLLQSKKSVQSVFYTIIGYFSTSVAVKTFAAQEEVAHEESAQEESAHEESAQDEVAHEESAHEESAQDEVAQEESAHEESAQDEVAHEESAQDNLREVQVN
jgi:hypothetical protein